MRRFANSAAVLAFGMVMATPLFSQNQVDQQPCPEVAEDAVGCEPIAWSRLQEPVPLPDAASPPDRPGAKEGPGASSETQSSDFEGHRQRVQTIVGVIIRNQEWYLLRVSAAVTLALEGPQVARHHEGERVRIKGVVDHEKRSIHVESITPIS